MKSIAIDFITCVIIFLSGAVTGFFYSQSTIEDGQIKESQVVTHKTDWIQQPPKKEIAVKSDPALIYENYRFYKQSYNSPITINHALNNNWMYIDATDGYKSSEKEIELFSIQTTDWRLLVGAGIVGGALGALVYHQLK